MSMTMIKAFLYAISALVVGAFFTIWTVQRSRELAVMRAMGASTGFLMLDGLMQALIVLLSSVGAGVLLGLGLGAMLLGTGMPFALEASPIIGGAVLLTVVALDHVDPDMCAELINAVVHKGTEMIESGCEAEAVREAVHAVLEPAGASRVGPAVEQ
jgi:hypothetical protein